MNELMAFLKKVFKLPDTATDEDVMKAFQGAVSMPSDGGGEPVPCTVRIIALEAAVKPLQALVAADGTLTTLSAGFAGLQTRIGDVNVQEKITTLSTAIEGVSKDVACFMARVAGKVVPLSAADLAKTPLETLNSMIAALPVTVPVVQLTTLSAASTGSSETAPTADEVKVARACGMDPAKVYAK
jgi:hypothetical protein